MEGGEDVQFCNSNIDQTLLQPTHHTLLWKETRPCEGHDSPQLVPLSPRQQQATHTHMWLTHRRRHVTCSAASIAVFDAASLVV